MASLLAPPTAGVLPSLEQLYLYSNQITDEGCAALASALRGGALPAVSDLRLGGNPASEEAQEAACEVPDARLEQEQEDDDRFGSDDDDEEDENDEAADE